MSNKETAEVRLIVLFFEDLSVFVPSDTGGVFCLSVDVVEGRGVPLWRLLGRSPFLVLPTGGATPATEPIDLRGARRGEELGEASGEAIGEAPGDTEGERVKTKVSFKVVPDEFSSRDSAGT